MTTVNAAHRLIVSQRAPHESQAGTGERPHALGCLPWPTAGEVCLWLAGQAAARRS